MPLRLLRGDAVCPRAPAVTAEDGEDGLLRAYLTFFGREAGRMGHRARAGLFGLDAGFTAERSLSAGVRAAGIFLAGYEAEITILVPKGLDLGAGFPSELNEYIARRYSGAGGGIFGRALDRTPRVRARKDPGRRRGAEPESTVLADDAPMCASLSPQIKEEQSLEDLLRSTDAGFTETLLRLIDESGEKDPAIYKRANIDRKLFSKIRSNPGYRPSKSTALALALALRLDLDKTRDLIGRAGYTLTRASRADIIVEYFIVTGKYDIFEINETLFRYDLPILGGA